MTTLPLEDQFANCSQSVISNNVKYCPVSPLADTSLKLDCQHQGSLALRCQKGEDRRLYIIGISDFLYMVSPITSYITEGFVIFLPRLDISLLPLLKFVKL